MVRFLIGPALSVFTAESRLYLVHTHWVRGFHSPGLGGRAVNLTTIISLVLMSVLVELYLHDPKRL
jgi:hypothetical protein